jgi:putative transcriptional regulator
MTDKKPNRLTRSLLETADDMRRVGVIGATTHQKITVRHLGTQTVTTGEPMAADDIRTLRQSSNISQAVFARYLNLTTGYVSQLERGTKRPAGPVLALLNVIRRKGIEAIL